MDGAVRPRLGYLVPGFPGPTHPPAWREVRALEAQGVEVRLLTDRPPAACPHPWAAEARARTVALASRSPLDALAALPALPWGEMAGREPRLARALLAALPVARRLARACAAEGVGHLHVLSCGPAALAAALAERMGGPSYSLALLGPLGRAGPGQNLKWGGARFATVADRKLLAEVRTVLRRDAPARITVQPLGLDPGAPPRAAPYAPHRPGEPLRLVACGRLAPEAGHEDLLEALPLLKGAGLDPRLEIAGEDAEGGQGHRRALEARARALGLGDRVRWLGAVDEARVAEALGAAHLFVHPAREGGVPVALMEAMAAGLPVVATAAGGVRELVAHGEDGVVVPARQPALLARAIRELAAQPARAIALAMAGRRRVERDRGADRGAATLMGLLGLRPLDEILDDLPPMPAPPGPAAWSRRA